MKCIQAEGMHDFAAGFSDHPSWRSCREENLRMAPLLPPDIIFGGEKGVHVSQALWAAKILIPGL